MKRLLTILALLTASRLALAHAGHWHLDEETLEKIFAAADAVYAWFAANLVFIATGVVVILSAWFPWWWLRQRKAEK